jgi:hypothetical protein
MVWLEFWGLRQEADSWAKRIADGATPRATNYSDQKAN